MSQYDELVTLFRKDDLKVIEVGTAALRYQVIAFPLNAWIVMCNMMLQSVGKGLNLQTSKSSIRLTCPQSLHLRENQPHDSVLQSVGKGLKASIVASARQGLCFIPLCDLTSGSGDKGTPVILIQGYFDNYTN